MKCSPAARGSQDAGITQPRDHPLADLCKDLNIASIRSMQLRRYRELGNQAFVKGMDWKALELYNEAVCQAPREQGNTKEQV